MAENATTTSRVHFPSAGAVRRRPSTLERAHLDLVRTLASIPPPRLRGAANLAGIGNVIDHLQDVFLAVTAYMDAAVVDTTDHLPVNRTNRGQVETLLWDMVNEDDHHDLGRWLAQAGCRVDLPALAA